MGARKYAKLIDRLKVLRTEMDAQKEDCRNVTFAQVEHWAEEPLPPAAYKHRPWWSNNINNSNSNRPWDRAYFRTEDVDMKARTVVFRKLPLPSPLPRHPFNSQRWKKAPPSGESGEIVPRGGLSDVAHPFRQQCAERSHPLRGALKGTIRITVDVDLTAPADPEWGNKP